MTQRHAQGFALPTVLIASMVMLIVLFTTLSMSSSTRVALDGQYYTQLAKEAAESGVVHANDCLSQNNYISKWAGNYITPETPCTGTASPCVLNAASPCYFYKDNEFGMTYEVQPLAAGANERVVRVIGKVVQFRQSGEVYNTYTYQAAATVAGAIGFGKIAFGYHGFWDTAFFSAIDSRGQVIGVGWNGYGQQGNGATSDANLTPVSYDTTNIPNNRRIDELFVNFTSGGAHLFALDNQGDMYASGNNDNGQLGIGAATGNEPTPKRVQVPITEDIKTVGINTTANYFVTQSGRVYSAGGCSGNGYALGAGNCTGNVPTPQLVPIPGYSSSNPSTYAVDVNTDYATTVVRLANGKIYGWGDSTLGQFGNGSYGSSATPVQVGNFGNAGIAGAKQVITGFSTYVVDNNGRLWATGKNSSGDLARCPATEKENTFQQIAIPSNEAVEKIASDEQHLVILTSSGKVYTVGMNQVGQLGNGNTSTQCSLQTFQLPAGVVATDIYANSMGDRDGGRYNNTFVVGSNGRAYGSGSNYFGQLGDGTTTNRSTPVAMNVINGTEFRAKAVQSGGGTTVVLADTGLVFTVGRNHRGQLGDGTTTDRTSPAASRYANVVAPLHF